MSVKLTERQRGAAPAAELAVGQRNEGEGASGNWVIHCVLSITEGRQQRRYTGNGIRNDGCRPADAHYTSKPLHNSLHIGKTALKSSYHCAPNLSNTGRASKHHKNASLCAQYQAIRYNFRRGLPSGHYL